jgi:hypothetical protein
LKYVYRSKGGGRLGGRGKGLRESAALGMCEVVIVGGAASDGRASDVGREVKLALSAAKEPLTHSETIGKSA